MSYRRGRFTGIIVVIASLFVAVMIGGVFYYFQVTQNENYQNQLHFHELTAMTKSLENGVSGVISVANNMINEEKSQRKEKNDLKNEIDELQTLIRPLEDLYNNSKEIETNIRQGESKLKRELATEKKQEVEQNNKNILDKQKQIETHSDKLKRINKELDRLENRVEKLFIPIELLTDKYGEEALDATFDDCAGEIYCQWLTQVFDFEQYEDQSGEKLKSKLQSHLNNSSIEGKKILSALTIEVKLVNAEITALRTLLDPNVPIPVKATVTLACDNDELWPELAFCQDIVKTKNELMSSAPSDAPSSKRWRLLENKITIELNDLTEILDDNRSLFNFLSGVNSFIDNPNYKRSLLVYASKYIELDANEQQISQELSTLYDELNLLEDSKQASLRTSASNDSLTNQTTIAQTQYNAASLRGKLNEQILSDAKLKVESHVSQMRKQYKFSNKLSMRNEVGKYLSKYLGCVDLELNKLKPKLKQFCKAELTDLTTKIFVTAKNFGKKTKLIEAAFSSSVLHKLSPEQIVKIEEFSSLEPIISNKLNASNNGNNWQIIAPFGLKEGDKELVLSVPLSDLISDSSDYFPLIVLADSQGNSLLRKEEVKHDAFQHGMQYEQIDQLLKKLYKKQAYKSDSSPQHPDTELKLSHQEKGVAFNLKKDGNDKNVPGYSGYVDVTIASEDYRVFISPWYVDDLGVNTASKGKLFYLLGFKSKSDLLTNKLAISNSLIVIVCLIVLALIAMMPLVKIRLISYKQSFSIADRKGIVFGLMMLMMVFTVGVFQELFYSKLKYKISEIANEIHLQIKTNFNEEIKTLITQGRTLNESLSKQKKPNELIKAHDDKKGLFLEGVFNVGSNGSFDGVNNGRAKWSSTGLFIHDDVSLTHREYINKALNCDGWEVETNDEKHNDCRDLLFMERIFNISDGRKNTFFSYPIFKEGVSEVSPDEFAVLSFGTRLQSLLAPILPQSFGFFVLDNETGTVFYHSDEDRSLVENAFVETDNNEKLQGFINAEKSQKSVEFEGTYRGKTHLLVAGELVQGIPWTLVVFYDKTTLRSLNLLSVITVLCLAFLLMLMGYVIYQLFKIIRPKFSIIQFMWFDSRICSGYKRLTLIVASGSLITPSLYMLFSFYYHEMVPAFGLLLAIILGWLLNILLLNRMYPKVKEALQGEDNQHLVSGTDTKMHYFISYLMSIMFCFIAIPILVLSLSSAGFYLQKYADADALHLAKQYRVGMDARKSYFELVIDNPTTSLKKKYQLVPCYLGTKVTSEVLTYPGYCDQSSLKSNAQQMWHNLRTDKSNDKKTLLALVWQGISVKLNFANDVWLMNKLDKTDLKIPTSASRLLLQTDWNHFVVLLILILVSLSYTYWILREWICKRLMGLTVPENFRLCDNLQQAKQKKRALIFEQLALSTNYRVSQSLFQIIRPTESLVRELFEHVQPDDLSQKNAAIGTATGINFIAIHPIAIDELTIKDGVVQHNGLRIESNDQMPLRKTLVLKGLELVAMHKDLRLKSLKVLEMLACQRNLNIVLLGNISPLYRLTNQGAYPNDLAIEDYASNHEVIRWSRLIRRFSKLYDWTPNIRHQLAREVSAYDTLIYETDSWPETLKLKHEFIGYHCATKDLALVYHQDNTTDLNNKKVNQDLVNSINKYWSSEQVIEFFSANAGAIYRYRWELCTRDERLLLIQIASDNSPNPNNFEPLEHLIRRGYIYRDNGWFIVNRSFKRFALSAEKEETVAGWLEAAAESNWKYVRIPIVTLVLVLFGVLAYSVTDAIESVMAIMTGVLGIFPLLLRNFSAVRGVEVDTE